LVIAQNTLDFFFVQLDEDRSL